MRTSTRRLALVAGAVFSLAAAGGAALAQVPPPPPAPPAPPAPPPPPMPPMEAMMAGGHAMVMMGRMGGHGDPAAHAQHLRDVLQLRPDQDSALKAYLEATGPGAMKDAMKPDDMDDDGDDRLTTPERLDRQAQHMTRMAETFQKRAAATKAFYAALEKATGVAPRWNFHKYLVDKNGKLVDHYNSTTNPNSDSVRKRIDKLLAE